MKIKRMDENLLASGAALAIALPDLKKKENERNKGGVLFQLPGAGAASFQGAVGGAGAAARAAALTAIEEAQAAQGVGVFSRLIGSPAFRFLLTASRAALAKLAAALVVAAASFLFYAARHARGAASAGAGALGSASGLAAPSSTIRVRLPKDSASLGYAARSSAGQLSSGAAPSQASAPELSKEAAPAGAAQGDSIAQDAQEIGDALISHPELASRFGTMSGAKLTSELAGADSAASFGKNDVFGGAGAKIGGLDKGRLSAFRTRSTPAARGGLARSSARGVGGMRFRVGRASQALGQLRGMGGVVSDIRNATETGTAENSATQATKQWENSAPTGAAPPSPVDGGAASTGGSVPNIPNPSNVDVPAALRPFVDISACTQDQINQGLISDGQACSDPKDAHPNPDTPWQPLVDAANGLMIAASALTMACAITRMIGKSLEKSVFPATVAAGKILNIVGMVLGIVGAVCGAIAAILGIVIAAKYGQTAQGTTTAVGGLVAAVSALTSAFTENPTGLGGIMALIGGAMTLAGGIAQDSMKGDDPSRQPVPIVNTAELPKPPAGEHYETSGDPTDPNNNDWHLVADGNPPGQAPAGTQWVHDEAGSGWTLEPDRSGQGLPSLPPGQHYENGKPADDGLAPYAAPQGDRWEHSDATNGDPNAWVLYDANGNVVAHSAGVSPDGSIFGSTGK